MLRPDDDRAIVAAGMLEGLNREQKAAVEHFGSPLLLLAGAGSGKTKVLTHKIGYLITEKGVRPHRILAITFTKKAAREMAARVETMLKVTPRSISTFHSFCVRVLREDIAELGRRFDRKFIIYDQSDSKKTLKDIVKRFNLDPREADEAHKTISKAKQTYRGDIVQHIASLPFPHDRYAEVARAYEEELERSNALDYDDLLHHTTHLFVSRPEVLEKWQARYDFIMVDEFTRRSEISFARRQTTVGQEQKQYLRGGRSFPDNLYLARGGPGKYSEVRQGF